MSKIITKDNLDLFAFTNRKALEGKPKAVMLDFHGLGYNGMRDINDVNEGEKMYASHGVLYVFPYYGPWNWMNNMGVKYTDDVIDAIFDLYELSDETPIISTGGSMGGCSALAYTCHARRTPTACAANCPVCDLPYHYTERPDLPRTLYGAFGHYEGDLMAAIETASPLHLVDKMPTSTKYYVVHGDKDSAVNKGKHSDCFVEAMKKNHDIKYDEVPGMEHCALAGEAWEKYLAFILSFVK